MIAISPIMARNGTRSLFVLLALCSWSSPCLWGEDARPRIENSTITVSLDPADGTLGVLDKRTGQQWRQKPAGQGKIISAVTAQRGIAATWHDAGANLDVDLVVQVSESEPEFTISLAATGALKRSLRYPHPFVTEAGTCLVVPMNEGISYPVDDRTVETRTLITYGGHGICMPFWGATDGQRGYMAIMETPDDAAIQIGRFDEKLCVTPVWEAQKGNFGYTRKLRYVFLDKGGHVGMCKRYRAYARQAGLLKTLDEKRRENPNVDLLVGAVNVWYWENDARAMVRELQA